MSRAIDSIPCLMPIKQGSSVSQGAITSEIERENMHVNKEYGGEIDEY